MGYMTRLRCIRKLVTMNKRVNNSTLYDIDDSTGLRLVAFKLLLLLTGSRELGFETKNREPEIPTHGDIMRSLNRSLGGRR